MDHFNWTRREAITKAGMAGGGLVLAGGGLKLGVPGFEDEEALAAGACIMTPDRTIGPYFIEENLNRSDVRAEPDGSGAQAGIPLTLTMYVFNYDAGCAPVAGAKVDIWHANAAGRYSDVSQNNTTGQKWLRGFQTTDSAGKVSFTTIFPGFYQGRTVHIHVRVRVGSVDFVTQIFFDESQTQAIMGVSPYKDNNTNGTRLTNARDNIYQQAGNGSQLLVTLNGSNDAGYSTEFSAGIAQGSSSGNTGTTKTDKVVSVALSAVRVLRYRGGNRTLRVRFKTKETVYVTARLTRRSKLMATRKSVKLTAGSSKLLKVRVPRKYGAGAAKLTLKVADANGNAKTYSRAVHVPRKRR